MKAFVMSTGASAIHAAAGRARPSSNPLTRALAKALFGLSAMVLTCSASDRGASAAEHDIRICNGYYALCAASICTPTGKTISVNVSGGGTARYPEAECTCPIFSGKAIADVAGGNMKGSCKPDSPEEIWSLYSVQEYIPQEINRWLTNARAAAAPVLYCSKHLNLGNQLANCWSFSCDSKRYINGVPVATCSCPIGESPEGAPVAPHTGFVTSAGQDDREFCARHPVGGPISFP
jgi:hypothetical protein